MYRVLWTEWSVSELTRTWTDADSDSRRAITAASHQIHSGCKTILLRSVNRGLREDESILLRRLLTLFVFANPSGSCSFITFGGSITIANEHGVTRCLRLGY
jgi:hypothetical protein